MGNCESLCCKGARQIDTTTKLTPLADRDQGRPKEGPYESALADSEREAVADLLQYLENVSTLVTSYTITSDNSPASGDRLLYWRPS